MIHIRIDNERENDKRRFACGIGPALPPGDQYMFESELLSQFRINKIDCPGCNPGGIQPFGTPLSELSGRPGTSGYAEFTRIAESWGYP